MENKKVNLEEKFLEISNKIERTATLMKILEHAIEDELDINKMDLERLCYILSDYIEDIKKKFAKLENEIVNKDSL